jgi:hypothetical protein
MIHQGDTGGEKGGFSLVDIQNNPHYSLLKNNEGKVFRLAFTDGEVVVAKVLHVDHEYEDFIYVLISSTVVREH